MLSIATDYAKDFGCPHEYLVRIAEAGFTHVHWCHHWCTDFLYAPAEVSQIGRWLNELDLKLLDLHASHGREKAWMSAREYERLAGLELVANRIEMTADLGGDAIVIHLDRPNEQTDPQGWDRAWRSLDALEGVSRKRGVRIAVENGSFDDIAKVCERYAADYVGLCLDSGHNNIGGNGSFAGPERLKDRLVAVHLHDNDGKADQHKPLFSGTTDWEALAAVIARSAYAKPVSMEVGIQNSGFTDESAFLAKAFETGSKFADMVAHARKATKRRRATRKGPRKDQA